jgi:hypothetical protein
VRAETCSDVACIIYTRKEVVAKEEIITVFICKYSMILANAKVKGKKMGRKSQLQEIP